MEAAASSKEKQTPLKRTVKQKLPTPEAEEEGEQVETKEKRDTKKGMSVLETSVRKDMERYPDAILLTQVGSFFEVSSL